MDTKINIGPVIVGEPIEIEVRCHGDDFKDVPPEEGKVTAVLIVKSGDYERHRVITQLNQDADSPRCFKGEVDTFGNSSDNPGLQPNMLKVFAGDKIIVRVREHLEETIAYGIYASDILPQGAVSAHVFTDENDLLDVNKLDVTVESYDGSKFESQHILVRDDDNSHLHAQIGTYQSVEKAIGENVIRVQERDRVKLSCRTRGDKEYRWEVVVVETIKVNIEVSGGVSPGIPVEVTITDLDRVDEEVVPLYIFNQSSKRIYPKELQKIENSDCRFSGKFNTALQSSEKCLAVQASDILDIVYRDTRHVFHTNSLQIIEPSHRLKPIEWKKKNVLCTFFMPSLRPLLAELQCLEVRMNYYRSTAKFLFQSNRIKLLEDYLLQAAKNLRNNRWDVTPAWEALHHAKRLEIYLCGDAEAEGEVSAIRADLGDMISPGHQNEVKVLLEKSKQHRKRKSPDDKWRGFIDGAMKVIYEQQDNYFIKQNMVRDRMVMMTALLFIFLSIFVGLQWNSNISDALVNNHTIKDIFSKKTPYSYNLSDIETADKANIRFIGETVVGVPLVIAVYDPNAGAKPHLSVKLSCSKFTQDLCSEFESSYDLHRVLGEERWFRAVFETAAGDPEKGRGLFIFKPGAQLIAEYKIEEDPAPLIIKTGMISSANLPNIKLSSGMIVFASCLLGAIGACLSSLIDLRTGNQTLNYKDSPVVTFVRPVIGFTAALMLSIAINSKLINIEPTLTMFWLSCFISGFSDRYFLGIVGKIDGVGKGVGK